MLAGGVTLFLIQLIGQFLLKKESMGMGEVKLAGVVGFYIGWELFLIALFSGSLIAFVIAFVARLFKNQSTINRIPFAPYLSTRCIIAILLGRDLWNWYIQFFYLPSSWS